MNANEKIFFKRFDGAVRKIFFEDKEKFMVLSWIIFKTNYQEEYQGLKRNECYFSYSIVENECSVSRKKLQRILSDLEQESFITWIHKSNAKNKKSVIFLIETGYGSENGLGYGSEYGRSKVNANTTGNQDTVNNTVEDMVKDTSSRNISIYSANDYEDIWKLYPCKKGKATAIKKIPQILKQYSKEELIRCIERYCKDVDFQRKTFAALAYVNGSTFFNGRYEDYLDCNYQEIELIKKREITDFDDE